MGAGCGMRKILCPIGVAVFTAIICFLPLVFVHELGHLLAILVRGEKGTIILHPENMLTGGTVGETIGTGTSHIIAIVAGPLTSYIVGICLIAIGLKTERYKRLMLMTSGCVSIVFMLNYLMYDTEHPNHQGDYVLIFNYLELDIGEFLMINQIISISTMSVLSFVCTYLVATSFIANYVRNCDEDLRNYIQNCSSLKLIILALLKGEVHQPSKVSNS